MDLEKPAMKVSNQHTEDGAATTFPGLLVGHLDMWSERNPGIKLPIMGFVDNCASNAFTDPLLL